MKNLFENVAANEKNEKWNNIIKREKELYKRNNDIRSEIERDYTRIIHSTAYRRMKHKTQVFFSPENDHICTRIEHVTYVESISHTIAKYLGLNIDLTKAIATAHDLGHAPFGHEGERVLSKISQRDLGEKFWHEKNGLDFVDKIELLEDNLKNEQNLNLTYGVRDGIISHCGEIDENALVPRKLTIKNNVRIIDTEKGSFVFKKKGNNRNVDNIYKYLTSRAFDYYPNKIDETDEYEMYEYIEDYNEQNEQKAVDIINLLTLLHSKTTFYKEVDFDYYKEIYEELV